MQVWQAIEKVLLEDSLCQPVVGGEGQHFTQLAPVVHLLPPSEVPQGTSYLLPNSCHQPTDACKVTDWVHPYSRITGLVPPKPSHVFIMF